MHVVDEAKRESLLTTDEGTLSSTPGSMGIGGAREEQQLWSEIPQSGSTCRERGGEKRRLELLPEASNVCESGERNICLWVEGHWTSMYRMSFRGRFRDSI